MSKKKEIKKEKKQLKDNIEELSNLLTNIQPIIDKCDDVKENGYFYIQIGVKMKGKIVESAEYSLQDFFNKFLNTFDIHSKFMAIFFKKQFVESFEFFVKRTFYLMRESVVHDYMKTLLKKNKTRIAKKKK